MNDKETKSSSGRASWVLIIFLAVVAVHVVAILGIAVFNGWRYNAGTATPVKTDTPAPAPVQTPADASKEQQTSLAAKSEHKAAPSTKRDENISTTEQTSLLKEIIAGKDDDEGEEEIIPDVPATTKKSSVDQTQAANTAEKETAKKTAPADPIKKETESAKSVTTDSASTKEKTTAVSKTAHVASTSSKTTTSASSKGVETYNVQKGDTLSKIARLYNTTTENLLKLNSIKDPNTLKPGMAIKVPRK